MAVQNDIKIPVHQRLGNGGRASSQPRHSSGASPKVCIFWLQGRCNRHPCRFLHENPSTTAPPARKRLVWLNPNRNGVGCGEGGGPCKKVKCEVTGRSAVRGRGDAVGVAEEVHAPNTGQREKGSTDNTGSASVDDVAVAQVSFASQVATEVLKPCSFFCRSVNRQLGGGGGGGSFSRIAALEGGAGVNPKRTAVRGRGDAVGVAEEVHAPKTGQHGKGNTNTTGSASVYDVAIAQVRFAPHVATEVLKPRSLFCRSVNCQLGDGGGGGSFSRIEALEGGAGVNPKRSDLGSDKGGGPCKKVKFETGNQKTTGTLRVSDQVDGGGPCKKAKCKVTERLMDDAGDLTEEVFASKGGQLEKGNTNTAGLQSVSGCVGDVAVELESSDSQVATEVLKHCSFYSEETYCQLGYGGGVDFSMIVELEGHQKPIKGIALPPGSNKLFSASSDGSVKIWDWQSSLRIESLNLGCEISCLVGDEGWVFVGVPGAIKAWSSQTGVNLSLDVPGGRQACSLVMGNINCTDFLFAGFQDGSILVWTFNATDNHFEPAAGDVLASFMGAHSQAVVTLVVGRKFLYSGSLDSTIKVWNLETLKCVQTLTSHGGPVTSILCWCVFMLSGSLDGTVKVWGANMESGPLELTYTHKEEHGVVALGGMFDAESKPVLFCSCANGIAHLYHLPSFEKKGWIFFNSEARHIQTGPEDLFFTGDGAGQLKVWKWI